MTIKIILVPVIIIAILVLLKSWWIIYRL